MADIFHEVDEQLRAERMRTLFLRAAPWAAGALVLALAIALGVWGYGKHRASVDARASEGYAAGIEALQTGDEKVALDHFRTTAEAGSAGYEALALIQQAGLKLRERKSQEAVALLDRAADVSKSPLLADVAKLQAAYVLMDTGPLIEVEGRLRPLIAEDRPYRAQAREALALARLVHGDAKGAREELTVLVQGLDTPRTIRARAEGTIGLIDAGLASSVPAALKAAVALPPEAVEAAEAAQAIAQMQAQQSPPAPQAGTEQ